MATLYASPARRVRVYHRNPLCPHLDKYYYGPDPVTTLVPTVDWDAVEARNLGPCEWCCKQPAAASTT